MIIYLAGVFCAVWCAVDIFRKRIGIMPKILVSVAVLATSWVGILLYYLWAGRHMEEWFK